MPVNLAVQRRGEERLGPPIASGPARSSQTGSTSSGIHRFQQRSGVAHPGNAQAEQGLVAKIRRVGMKGAKRTSGDRAAAPKKNGDDLEHQRKTTTFVGTGFKNFYLPLRRHQGHFYWMVYFRIDS